MKLILKQTDDGVCLHTEDGLPLPQQLSVKLESVPGDIVKVTVVFALGDDVVLGSDILARFGGFKPGLVV